MQKQISHFLKNFYVTSIFIVRGLMGALTHKKIEFFLDMFFSTIFFLIFSNLSEAYAKKNVIKIRAIKNFLLRFWCIIFLQAFQMILRRKKIPKKKIAKKFYRKKCQQHFFYRFFLLIFLESSETHFFLVSSKIRKTGYVRGHTGHTKS